MEELKLLLDKLASEELDLYKEIYNGIDVWEELMVRQRVAEARKAIFEYVNCLLTKR